VYEFYLSTVRVKIKLIILKFFKLSKAKLKKKKKNNVFQIILIMPLLIRYRFVKRI